MNNLEINQIQDPEANATIRLRYFPMDEDEAGSVAVPLRDALLRTDELEQLLLSLHDPEISVDSAARRSIERNHRQYARCPLPEKGTLAILTVKGRSYDCQLIELSIGGFGVLVPGLPNLPIGAEGKLCAPGLNYITKITRQEIRPGSTFIGLRKIEEIVDGESMAPHASHPVIGYMIAAVAGALIATLMYYYKIGA